MPHKTALPAALLLLFAWHGAAHAIETVSVSVAEGALSFEAPTAWQASPPRNNLIEREFSVQPPDGSAGSAARLTVMAAGGSVDANIARWVGQFRDTEGGADRSGADVERIEQNGVKFTLVDIAGTYLDGRPFGPKTPREGYRMLAAIAQTADEGNYFFKLVGPTEAVSPAKESFREMVLSLQTVE